MQHKRYNAYNPLFSGSELLSASIFPLRLIDRALGSVGRVNAQLDYSDALGTTFPRKRGPFG